MNKVGTLISICDKLKNLPAECIKRVEESINSVISDYQEDTLSRKIGNGEVVQTEMFPGEFPDPMEEGKDIGYYDSNKGIYILPVKYVEVEWRSRKNSNKEQRKNNVPIRVFLKSIGFVSKSGLKKCRRGECASEKKTSEFCSWLEKFGVKFVKEGNKFRSISYQQIRDITKMLGAFGCYVYTPRDDQKLLNRSKYAKDRDSGKYKWVERFPLAMIKLIEIQAKEDREKLEKIASLDKKKSNNEDRKVESKYEKFYYGQKASSKKRKFAHVISSTLNIPYPHGPETNRDIDAFIKENIDNFRIIQKAKNEALSRI